MNVKEYISSGIVESYVLGMANDVERHEFESLSAQYPEIVEARTEFELLLEERLMSDAIAPPIGMKEKIWATINESEPLVYEGNGQGKAPVKQMQGWKWIAAASIILLIGALFWVLTAVQKNEVLERANYDLQERLNQSSQELSSLKSDASVLQQPGLRVAALQGTPAVPNALATVYWDTTSKDVYLMINNLPKTPSDQQYQLWALIDSQPVDLGVFEIKEERLLVKMKNVQNAQAFAITMEPKGGSVSPTLEKLCVIGNL